ERPVSTDTRKIEIGHIYDLLVYVHYFIDSVLALGTHLRQMNVMERYRVAAVLGSVYSFHGPFCAAIPFISRGIRYGERSLAVRQSLNDRWGIAQSYHFMSITLGMAGRWQECIEYGNYAEVEFRQLGDWWEWILSIINVGRVLVFTGQWD